jgi:hypothetical protein
MSKNTSFELLVPLDVIYIIFAVIKRFFFIKTDYIPVKTEEKLRHLTRTSNINASRCKKYMIPSLDCTMEGYAVNVSYKKQEINFHVRYINKSTINESTQ